MTTQEELDRINRILVEKGEGRCWHELDIYYQCLKCNNTPNFPQTAKDILNPDFSKWENFGRLLKIANGQSRDTIEKIFFIIQDATLFHDALPEAIDQIPLLCAKELAKQLDNPGDQE